MAAFPAKEDLTICFAHVAYRMAERFAARNTGIRHFQVNSLEELTVRIGDADVVSVSMMWRNNLIARAPKLNFIQSISAGTDQYSARRPEGRRHPPRQRARRERARGRRACDGADPRDGAPAPFRARQPGQAPVARHDLGSVQARGRARRQDAGDRRPRAHRLAPRRARHGLRHARDRDQARSGQRL